MRARERKALGATGGAIGAELCDRVEELHTAIADRSFRSPGARPVRRVHDAIAGGVYAGVRRGIAGGGRAAGAAASLRGDRGEPLGSTRAGALAQAALSGLIGDDLGRGGEDLAVEMGVRVSRREVEPEDAAHAIGDPTGRIAVFLHGLFEDEAAWELFREGHAGHTYPTRLREELGYTPVAVRFNSGLHISDNGRRLSALLERVVAAWPVEVREIALIGHSMGGLVARSACHAGEAQRAGWTAVVRHVFHLGTPHLGAPLEQAVNAAGWALGRLPETRPLARVLERRSAGIKDLRYGALVDDDWLDLDPDCLLDDRCTDVPLLGTANHYVISAQLHGVLGHLFGDLLVRTASAQGRGRRRRVEFEVDSTGEAPGLNHFQLLNHPRVYDQMHGWLARGEPGAIGAPAPALPRATD